jgi:hypothetical protein
MSQTPDVAPSYVSVVNEFPEDLYDAMRNFVHSHPHWDQYRLMQVAVAGFLFQQGSRERAVARHYLDGLFDRGAAAQLAPERQEGRGETGATPLPAVTPLRQRPEAQDRAAAPRRPAATPIPHHETAPPAFRLAA